MALHQTIATRGFLKQSTLTIRNNLDNKYKLQLNGVTLCDLTDKEDVSYTIRSIKIFHMGKFINTW